MKFLLIVLVSLSVFAQKQPETNQKITDICENDKYIVRVYENLMDGKIKMTVEDGGFVSICNERDIFELADDQYYSCSMDRNKLEDGERDWYFMELDYAHEGDGNIFIFELNNGDSIEEELTCTPQL
jgi:hypothetical protein